MLWIMILNFRFILRRNQVTINELNNITWILIVNIAGHEDIIKQLIKYDATVNVKNRIDWTPLFYSVLNGNERVVKLLINHEDEDFSLNDMDATGKTVSHICAEKGNFIRFNIDFNFEHISDNFVCRFCGYWKNPYGFWCKFHCCWWTWPHAST